MKPRTGFYNLHVIGSYKGWMERGGPEARAEKRAPSPTPYNTISFIPTKETPQVQMRTAFV